MAIVRYRPTSLLQTLQDEMNQVFAPRGSEQAFDFLNRNSEVATSQWNPNVDIQEKQDRYVVYADLPGVLPEKVEVSLDGNTLTIQGTRTTETKENTDDFSRIERFSGTFYRQFVLPDNIDSDAIAAKGKNGVLEIILPKKERQSSKKIQVSSED